ncbi:MAG: hypothetical protein HYR63_25325 [Proteobacteria bacterium]|nr:hypothetical protein [Pseudomonadota bacterium]MBI3497252.1 hypothetical protein [Pseudomonadota bacterium]
MRLRPAVPLLLAAGLWLLPAPASAGDLVAGTRFRQFETTDALGRAIVFYLSEASGPARPLVLFVPGSGCAPSFRRTPEGRVTAGYQGPLLAVVADRLRVLVVEKPGAVAFDPTPRGGTAVGCGPEFLREHTLERWTAALAAALAAARAMPGVDSTQTLVIGHSEGAVAAAHLSRLDPAITGIALLAGSGPSQLFDLLLEARRRRGEAGAAEVLAEANKISGDPDAVDRWAWGHPYRRWSSFLAVSSLEELQASRAGIYLAYGTEDTAVPLESSEVLHAGLLAAGRNPTVERRYGSNHSLDLPGQRPPEGMSEVFRHVVQWFGDRSPAALAHE